MYLIDDDAVCKPKLKSTSLAIRGSRFRGDDLKLSNMPKQQSPPPSSFHQLVKLNKTLQSLSGLRISITTTIITY